jgi:hypothetical protein
LLAPINNQLNVEPTSLVLTWQVSPNVSSSNYLKYVIKVMTIDESEQIPTSLDNYCSSCINVIDNVISFQSESGSYTFNAETCKKYIWQITLIEDIPSSQDADGNPIPASQQIVGQSLVHSFTTNCTINARVVSNVRNQYFTFPKEFTSYVYGLPNSSSKLFFKYECEYNRQTITYNIYDEFHKPVYSSSKKLYNIVKGVNYLNIDLPNISRGSLYYFEVCNEKNNTKYFKFRKE